MRITHIVHATFATTMIGLGAIGLFRPDFVPVWNPVPATIPARELILYLGALISLTCGIGLLVQRVAIIAARVLLATLLFWLLLFRLPNFLHASAFEACWSVFPLAVMLAAAWVLYVWLAADWDRMHLRLISGNNGLRIARVLYGLCLIFFGTAHFIDIKDTVSLIPNWLPAHLFWVYFTGSTFIAAGAERFVCTAGSRALSRANRTVPAFGVDPYRGGRLQKFLPVERDHPQCGAVRRRLGGRRFLPWNIPTRRQQIECWPILILIFLTLSPKTAAPVFLTF